MPQSNRSFRLLTAVVIALFFCFLYLGWTILFRAERQRVSEQVEKTVEQASDSLQRANLTESNIAGHFDDSEGREKMAFAIGVTGNLGKMTIDFGDKKPTGQSKSDTAPVITAARIRADKVKFHPEFVRTIKNFDTVLRAALQGENLAIPYRIVPITPANRFNWRGHAPYQTRPFVINFFDPAVYALTYRIPSGLVIRRLWPYLLAASLILGLLIGALHLFRRAFRARLDAEQLRSSLFSNATHELKTPLSSLQLIMEAALAKESSGPDEQVVITEAHARFAEAEINRMKLLVSRILSFGRLDSAQFALDKHIVDINTMVEGALDALQLIIRERNALIHYQPAAGLAIKGESLLLTNLIISLLENALKHTPGVPEVRISAARKVNDVIISVSDNGPGIPVHNRKRIFEPFFRGPDCMSGGISGHGLGLCFALQVARMHGGDISVSEGAMGGANFIVRLNGACSALS